MTSKKNMMFFVNRDSPIYGRVPPKKPSTPEHKKLSLDSLQLEVKRLLNLLSESKQEIKQLKEENRTLTHVQRVQDRSLTKMNKQNEDTPQLLSSLYEEVRVCRKQIAQQREKVAAAEKALREIHVEYTKQKETNERFRTILQGKNLQDNDVLVQRVHALEDEVMDKEDLIADLQYRIEDLEYKSKSKKNGGQSADPKRPRPPHHGRHAQRSPVEPLVEGAPIIHVKESEIPPRLETVTGKAASSGRGTTEQPASKSSTTPIPALASNQSTFASSFPTYSPEPVALVKAQDVPDEQSASAPAEAELAQQSSATAQQASAPTQQPSTVTSLPQKSILKPNLKGFQTEINYKEGTPTRKASLKH